MKKALMVLVLGLSTQAFAGVNLDTSRVELNPEISKYLSQVLTKCSLSHVGEETFAVEKMNIKKVRVDQGIVDEYYTFDISYKAFRNDEIVNSITVEVLDADFDNWREYSEKLSYEIKSDANGFCTK